MKKTKVPHRTLGPTPILFKDTLLDSLKETNNET